MKAYFLGVAGAGVSALASILKSEGWDVSGSDDGVFPPISTYLDRAGIPYREGFDASAIPTDIDLAIVGTSAKLNGADNPELAELIARNVPRYTFAEYLGQYTATRDNALIAGSFGKSTLTAMIAFLAREAGRDPGWFIGAIPLDLNTTGHAGTDPFFVIEADEYVVSLDDRRSKFELYTPQVTLISSIVHDHVNMFPTFPEYVAPFAKLVANTPRDGLLICARGFDAIDEITQGRDVIWYGAGEGPGYGARDIQVGETTAFTLTTPGGDEVQLETQLLGTHNIENLVGAAALLLERGLVTLDDLQRAIPKFRGITRRLDKKTTRSRAPVYEGFGSSYEKARSAIEAIQLHFPERKLVVVFEPHTFSWRNADALTWYDTVFEGVARVLMLAPPQHGAGGHKQLTQDEIVARVTAAGVATTPVSSGANVIADLERTMTGDEVVLLLSSGPLDGLADTLPPVLDARFG